MSVYILRLFHLACPEKSQVPPNRSYQKGSYIMKTIVRSLVVALALTGAIATSYASGSSAKATVKVAKTSAMPVPSCPPGDPDGCGIW